MNFSRIIPISVLLLISLEARANAQFYEGARPAALGDAYRAVASGNEAIYFNPAGMSLLSNRYNFDVGYAYNPTSGLNVFNASIVDGYTNPPLGAGVAFTYFLGNTMPRPGEETKGFRIDLALSYPISSKVLWGADIKYVNMDINGKYSAINVATGDVGFLFIFSKNFRGAITGSNLVPVSRPEFPYQTSVAVAAGNEKSFVFSTDVTTSFFSWSDIKMQVSAAPEIFLGEYIALRAGYLWDQNLSSQYFSCGLGIISPHVGIDASYRQNLSYTDDRSIYMVIRIFAGG